MKYSWCRFFFELAFRGEKCYTRLLQPSRKRCNFTNSLLCLKRSPIVLMFLYHSLYGSEIVPKCCSPRLSVFFYLIILRMAGKTISPLSYAWQALRHLLKIAEFKQFVDVALLTLIVVRN